MSQKESHFFRNFYGLIEKDNGKLAQKLSRDEKGIDIPDKRLKKATIFIGSDENLVVSNDNFKKSNDEFSKFYVPSEINKGVILLTPKKTMTTQETEQHKAFLGKKMFSTAAEITQTLTPFKIVNLPQKKESKKTFNRPSLQPSFPRTAKIPQEKRDVLDFFAKLKNVFDPTPFRNIGKFANEHSSKLTSNPEDMNPFFELNDEYIKLMEEGSSGINTLRDILQDLIDDPFEYSEIVNKINLVLRKDCIYDGSFESEQAKNELKYGLLHNVTQKIIELKEKKEPGFRKNLHRTFPDVANLSDREFYVKSKIRGFVPGLIESGELEKTLDNIRDGKLDVLNMFLNGTDLEKMTGEKFWEITKHKLFREIKNSLIESKKFTKKLFEREKEELDLMARFILEEMRENLDAFLSKYLEKTSFHSFGAPFRLKDFLPSRGIIETICHILGVLFFVTFIMVLFRDHTLQRAGYTLGELSHDKSINVVQNENHNVSDVFVGGTTSLFSSPSKNLMDATFKTLGNEGFIEKFLKYGVDGSITVNIDEMQNVTKKTKEKTDEIRKNPGKINKMTVKEIEENLKNLELFIDVHNLHDSFSSSLTNMKLMMNEITHTVNTDLSEIGTDSFVIFSSNEEVTQNLLEQNPNAKQFPTELITKVHVKTGLPFEDIITLVQDNTNENIVSKDFVDMLQVFSQTTEAPPLIEGERRSGVYIVSKYSDIETALQFDNYVLGNSLEEIDILASALTRKIEEENPEQFIKMGSTGVQPENLFSPSPSTFTCYLDSREVQEKLNYRSEYQSDPDGPVSYIGRVTDFFARSVNLIAKESYWALDTLVEEISKMSPTHAVISTGAAFLNLFKTENLWIPYGLDTTTAWQAFSTSTIGLSLEVVLLKFLIELASGSVSLVNLASKYTGLKIPFFKNYFYPLLNGLLRTSNTAINILSLHHGIIIAENSIDYISKFVPNLLRTLGGSVTIIVSLITVYKIFGPHIYLPFKFILVLFKSLWNYLLKKEKKEPVKKGKEEVIELEGIPMLSMENIYIGVLGRFSSILSWIISAFQGEKGGENLLELIQKEFNVGGGIKGSENITVDSPNASFVNLVKKQLVGIREKLNQKHTNINELEEERYILHIIYSIYAIEASGLFSNIFPKDSPYTRSRNIGEIIFPYVYHTYSSFRSTGKFGNLEIYDKKEKSKSLLVTVMYDRLKNHRINFGFKQIHKDFLDEAADDYKLTVQSMFYSASGFISTILKDTWFFNPTMYFMLNTDYPLALIIPLFLYQLKNPTKEGLLQRFFGLFFVRYRSDEPILLKDWSKGRSKAMDIFKVALIGMLLANSVYPSGYPIGSTLLEERDHNMWESAWTAKTFNDEVSRNPELFGNWTLSSLPIFSNIQEWDKRRRIIETIKETSLTPLNAGKSILTGFSEYYYLNLLTEGFSFDERMNEKVRNSVDLRRQQMGDVTRYLRNWPINEAHDIQAQYVIRINTNLFALNLGERISELISSTSEMFNLQEELLQSAQEQFDVSRLETLQEEGSWLQTLIPYTPIPALISTYTGIRHFQTAPIMTTAGAMTTTFLLPLLTQETLWTSARNIYAWSQEEVQFQRQFIESEDFEIEGLNLTSEEKQNFFNLLIDFDNRIGNHLRQELTLSFDLAVGGQAFHRDIQFNDLLTDQYIGQASRALYPIVRDYFRYTRGVEFFNHELNELRERGIEPQRNPNQN